MAPSKPPKSKANKSVAAEKPAEKEKRPLTETEALRIIDDLKSGKVDMEVEETNVVLSPEETFTEENIKKFILGEITLSQLEGVTMRQAYAIAEVGYTLMEQGKLEDARTIFEGLILGNPYDGYFHAILGTVYHKLGLEEKAIVAYTFGVELLPELLHAHTARGELLLKRGEIDQALKDFRKAIELDPEGKDPAGARARALLTATLSAVSTILEEEAGGRAKK